MATDFSGLAGSLAAGVLGGVFGGKAKTNPYANQVLSSARDLQDVRQGYRGLTNTATSGYQQYDPQYRQSVNSYADYLKTDPYTDSYSTQVLGQATAGTNSAYQAAKSNLAADMARRGISGSSQESGGLSSIESAKAANISSAQNNLALQKANAKNDRMSALVSLLGGVSNQYQNQAMQGYGAQTNVDNSLASIYGNLNGQANDVANAQNNATAAGWGALGSTLGTWLGSKPWQKTTK